MAKTGIDCSQDHAPRKEWLEDFFSDPQDFLLNYTLGSGMIKSFRKFLTDVLIIPERSKDRTEITETGKLIIRLGLRESTAWGIMLINGCYSTVLNWFVKNVKPNLSYTIDMLNDAIIAEYPKARKNRVPRVYKQILSLPFGTKLGFGKVTEEGKETYFQRSTWSDPEPLVILYALYKFAVACGDYYEFTLTRLLDHDIDSDGVSPTEIFCLERETMVPILKGLAINYPEYISVTFTHDLDAISLNREKAPIDVLKLITDER